MLDYLEIGSNLTKNIEGLRQPSSFSDIDLICTKQKFNVLSRNLISDGYTLREHTHPLKEKYSFHKEGVAVVEIEVDGVGGELLSLKDGVSDLDLAYTLKQSHKFLRNNPHFEKTFLDIKAMDKLGAKVPDTLKEWLKRREEQTYYYNHPNLKQSKEDFFDTKGVVYKYDHDSIHESVAIGDYPAYKKFLIGEVQTSKELFDKLPYSDKLNAVLEESCVLAIERSLVNMDNPSEETCFEVFKYSLQKVCTSITSGWFREFAWGNYDKCLKLYHSRVKNYYQKFTKALEEGFILPHKGKQY